MQAPTTYKTIVTNTTDEYKDRGSKFLAYTFPISKVEAVKIALNQLKALHPKAVHFCYAYRVGTNGMLYRANDDGEPAGSAGKPILGQIDSFGLTDVLVVVVRYFGGTLLGVPGLINAYKTAGSLALQRATVIEKNIETRVKLSFDYTIMNEIMTVLKQNSISIYEQKMQLFCEFEVGIPLAQKEYCLECLSSIYGLSIENM